MFTGIVQSKGWVLTNEPGGDGRTISIRCPELERDIERGESIAINGVCLTAEKVESTDQILHFHIIQETLNCTNLDQLDIGEEVNVEPSLRHGDSLSGHFVMGHVEKTGEIDRIEENEQERTMWIRAPEEVMQWMVPKGCIAVDGVSLTPVEVNEQDFSVELIPETLEKTTLGERSTYEEVNLEVDLLAKYVGQHVNKIMDAG